MESLGGIVVKTAKSGSGYAPMVVFGKDDDAHLCTQMARVETREVGNACSAAVGFDDEAHLSVPVDIGLLLFQILAHDIARERHTVCSPLPQFGIVLYPIDQLEILGLKGP